MQSRVNRILDLLGWAVGSALMSFVVVLAAQTVNRGELSSAVVNRSLEWGGYLLLLIAGGIGMGEAGSPGGRVEGLAKARLGQGHLQGRIPLQQVLVPAVGGVLLFALQALAFWS